MSVLDSVLLEERERLKRICVAMEKEVSEMPKGYLSRKVISGKTYFYLQRREGGKVIGKYVSAADAQQLMPIISRRQSLEKSIRECKSNIKRLEKII